MTASILTRVPITFATADHSQTHAPMVFMSVGKAEPARFVLDTGSEVHLFNEDLADELGFDKRPGEEGTDHSGTTLSSWSVGDVQVHLADTTLLLRDVVSIPAPPPFPSKGIRGILSAHRLHRSAFTVIDLAVDELLIVDGSDREVADFLAARSPSLQLLTLPRQAEFASVVVKGRIGRSADMAMMLNSGGKRTEFSASAVPGVPTDVSQRLGGGVSGSEYEGVIVGPQTLVVAGRKLRVRAPAVRAQMDDPQALVATDVLRGTVITCAADSRRPVFWQVRSGDQIRALSVSASRS